MHGLDNGSGVSTMPAIAPTLNPTPQWFTEGGANQPPSYPGQDWYNMIQAEILSVLAEADISPDKSNRSQLNAAIKKIISDDSLLIENNLSEIKNAGPAAVAQTLENLGLGEGSALPVGVPVPWPLAIPPAGWLKCNGAAFTAAQYPKLALAYPVLKLPDLRGEFLRGWDDGRGVDVGRALLSAQVATKLPSVYTYANSATSGVLVTPPITSFDGAYPSDLIATDYEEAITGKGGYFSTGDLTPRGSSGLSTFRVRPRNVAFNYIVRAA